MSKYNKYIFDLSYSQVLEIVAKQTLMGVEGIQDFTFNEALKEIQYSEELIMISPEDIAKGRKEYYFFLKCTDDSFLVDEEASIAEIGLKLLGKKFLVFNRVKNEFL